MTKKYICTKTFERCYRDPYMEIHPDTAIGKITTEGSVWSQVGFGKNDNGYYIILQREGEELSVTVDDGFFDAHFKEVKDE